MTREIPGAVRRGGDVVAGRARRGRRVRVAGVAGIAGAALTLGLAGGVAFGAASHPRPNNVDVQTPTARYDFHCGNESHPIPHAWLFRDCRRFTIGG